ncbi:hypothetical protein [Devosia sediminis]|uniref:Lipoprotein n=1 Tax=Devosia sediminis TaxID=2798801 RepID=A0A934IUT7_9HYPH|nr:hypothetical protein [Devosia sediminis]MBJ3783370.1 hypothetical protein [Devosia sediminis]
MRNLFILLMLGATSPVLACNPALVERLDAPVRDDADTVLDVAEIQSVEGGEWKVWMGDDGTAEEIVRIDYGEMGRLETRMVLDGAAAYGVTQTRYHYAAPIYAEGAATVRIETDIYVFCDAALELPPEDFGLNEDYAAAAKSAVAAFDAAEIAAYLPPGL